jgi:hypothetical protein
MPALSQQQKMGRRQSLIALAIFSLLATILLNRALLPDYTLLPLDLIQGIAPWDHLDLGPLANPLISDPLYQFFPSRYFQTVEIGNGQIPLWNPFILTGTPIMADPNSQPFYPPNLVAAVFLPTQHALPWLAWGHLILTGWLMYGFLRQQKLNWPACILGGGVWMLNAYLVVWLENPHRLSTLAWLPGIFWAYQKAVDERRLDYAAVGGLLLGLSILGGQVQFIFASGLILGIYALSIVAWDAYKQGRLSFRPLTPLLIIGVIGLGIGALTLIPAGEFAAYSQRVRFTSETVLRTRFPWQHLVTLIAPDFFGNPVNPEGYWGQLPNYAELAVYFGVISFVLALTAPFVARRRQFAFSAIILTIFVIAVIFGTPLIRLLFLFPGSQFVVLNRLLFLLPFCGAWLAAIGLDGWLANPGKQRWILAPILFLLILFTILTLWSQQANLNSHPATYADLLRSSFFLILGVALLLYLPRNPRLVAGMLVALAFLDLLQWGWDFNPITTTSYLYPDNGVVEYLQQDTFLYRVLPLQSEKLVFVPNVLGVFGIQTIDAYSSLIQADYYDLYKAISDQVDFPWLRSSPNKLAMSVFEPLVSLLNVKYVLSAKTLPTEEFLQIDQMGCDSAVFLNSGWTTEKFSASDAGLNRIDILLAPRPEAQDSRIQFRLWRDDVGGDLIAETEILATRSDVPESHTIFFDPVADSAGQPFVWGLAGEEDTAVCAVGPDQSLAFNAYGTRLISHGEIDGIWIYENPNTLPRAYMVHHAETVPSDQLLTRLTGTDFDFYHSVLITTPLSSEESDLLAAQPIRSQAQVEITSYDLHRVDLTVTTNQPGILILLDANYPGWEATVNGAEQEILDVNSVFRGIFLLPGTHSISFQFRHPTLYWGITLASLSILVALTIILWSKFSRGKIERLRNSEPL